MTLNELNETPRNELTLMVVNELQLKSKTKISLGTKEAMFHCPFHKDKTPSCGIDFTKGIYHCFSCGRKGNIESLYREITGISLFKKLGVKSDAFASFSMKRNIYQESEEVGILPRKRVYVNCNMTDFKNIDDVSICKEYLNKRGISLKVAHSFGMMYSDDTYINKTHFVNRLCIPIYDGGRLSSVEGRRLSESDEVKVIYPCNSSVDFIYDFDNLNKNDTCYGVEGLMDLAVLRGCSTFANSTALFGAAVTDRQIAQIKEFNKFVYIPDNDITGEKVLNKFKEKGLTNVWVLRLPKNLNNVEIKDVGDLPKANYTPSELVKRKWLNYIQKLD